MVWFLLCKRYFILKFPVKINNIGAPIGIRAPVTKGGCTRIKPWFNRKVGGVYILINENIII